MLFVGALARYAVRRQALELCAPDDKALDDLTLFAGRVDALSMSSDFFLTPPEVIKK